MVFSLDSTDRQFRRFCRSGDPAALGAVFDATAAELLRVACHLAGNRADAEDLVQRTFLAAIESRAAYEPRRRALPWLIGILANHARRLRRERRVPPAGAALASPDPSASAADRELTERLLSLRAELGEPYGEVLRLHLEQGLNAKEIAVSLQRPAGTVRTQLVRALALLRQRLPDGFLAAIAPFVPPSASELPVALAAMRSTILKSAGAATSVTGTVPLTVTGGWFVGKQLALVVPLVVAVVAFALHRLRQPEVAAAPGLIGSASERAAADERLEGAVPRAESPQRSVAASVVEALVEPDFATVRVVVRWRDDGAPAAGVGVFATNGRGVARRDAVTDAIGEGDLVHLRPGNWAIGCTFVERPREMTLVAGQVTVVELLAARRGVARGRVVDEQGRPVAAARIWMSTGTDLGHGHEVTSSDDDGAFEVPILIAHRIGARKAGYAPSRCIAVDPERTDAPPIELRLAHRGGVVAGFVHDPNGVPIPWAKVLFGDEQTARPPIDGRGEFLPRGIEITTDERGAFAADGVPAGLCEVRAWASDHAPFAGTVEVTANGRVELDLVLAEAAVVAGTVRDQTGAPVPGAALHWGAEYGFAWISTSSAADGSYRLEDMPSGPIVLTAERGTARRSAAITALPGATVAWDPVLATGLPIAGRLVGPNNEPLAGYLVMGQSGGDPTYATTDAEGRFRIDDAGSEPVAIEVSSEQSLLQVADVAPGTTDLLLRLDTAELPSAFLRGRVVDELGRPVAVHLGPAHVDSLRVTYTGNDPATGSFRLGPLRPGEYRLEGTSDQLGTRVLAMPRVRPGETLDLGDLLFSTPGTVVVTATVSGRAVVTGNVVFRRVEPRWFGTAAIEHGEARHAQLPPGRYYVHASARGVAGSAEVEVGAGSVVPIAIELQPTVAVQLTLRDQRGVAVDVLDPMITAWSVDGRFLATFRGPIGDTGTRFAADLPAGRVVVTAVVSDGRTARLELDTGAAAVVADGLAIDLPR